VRLAEREGSDMTDRLSPILERILGDVGIPDLIDVLANRLSPTDLQSLLLEVYQRRVSEISPSQLLERYAHDRFVRPSEIPPSVLAEFDRLVWSLPPGEYTAIELSPVCPLGTNAAIATVAQNNVVTTIRNTEVVADATNVLALECASRRRQMLRTHPQSRERVRLCASQRVVRGQTFTAPGTLPHFRLLGLCAAGRDEGSFQFEVTSLIEQITYYLQLLRQAADLGYTASRLRVALTDLEDGRRGQILQERVLHSLAADHPEMQCAMDPDRISGRGYYVGACFHIYATNDAGSEFELIDGGFTTWTQQLLNNRKERLLISGLGIERFCSLFRAVSSSGAAED